MHTVATLTSPAMTCRERSGKSCWLMALWRWDRGSFIPTWHPKLWTTLPAPDRALDRTSWWSHALGSRQFCSLWPLLAMWTNDPQSRGRNVAVSSRPSPKLAPWPIQTKLTRRMDEVAEFYARYATNRAGLCAPCARWQCAPLAQVVGALHPTCLMSIWTRVRLWDVIVETTSSLPHR